jgi:dihydroorotase
MAGTHHEPYELLVRGGTLVDPAQGIHAPRDVAFADSRVAAVETRIPEAAAARVINARGMLVVPGLIDLHVHVFDGVSHYGVAPDPHCLARGVTTAVDAGSAGADTFAGFRKYVIEASSTRILGFLNISAQGMISPLVGELDDIKWADVPRALQSIERNRDVILGVKVRLTRGQVVSERSGLEPLRRAREAADAARLPLMVHPQDAWCDSIDDILAVLRKGDILTHCYHDRGHGIFDDAGRIRRSVRQARARGVLFDVGHGMGSFSWPVCESALAQDFAPGTISSDLHAYNTQGPVFDLATTVSKFVHLGVPFDTALAMVTQKSAEVIGVPGIGTLAAGSWGDAAVVQIEEGAFDLVDSRGEARTAGQRIAVRAVIKGGRLYEESPARAA